MTTYTSAVQQQLIAALKNRQLTTLDFSHYIPEPPENLTFAGHTDQVLELAILPNGQMVSSSYDKTLRVWDASTGQCLKILKGHKEGVNNVAVLPNGYIVSGSYDYTLRVWDV